MRLLLGREGELAGAVVQALQRAVVGLRASSRMAAWGLGPGAGERAGGSGAGAPRGAG